MNLLLPQVNQHFQSLRIYTYGVKGGSGDDSPLQVVSRLVRIRLSQ